MQNILFFTKKYVKDILIILLVILLVVLGLIHFFYTPKSKEKELINEIALVDSEVVEEKKEVVKPAEEVKVETYHVDVKGAVKKPGVYEVTKEMMITDVISKAGGFNKNAYKNGINLSKKVVDEMVIYVYTKEEIKNMNSSFEVEKTCTVPDYNICECVEKKESVILPVENEPVKEEKVDTDQSQEKKEENTTAKVNINTADVKELTSLKGIGESKANSIIEYREQNNGFKTIDELKNIKGIGDSVFEKIKDHITI